MSDPIVEFIEHYLAEEENTARAAVEAGEPVWYSPSTGVVVVGTENGVHDMICFPDGRTARHVVVHDPQTVLIDIEVQRRLIGEILSYEAKIDGEWGCGHDAQEIRDGACPDHRPQQIPALRLLAARFSAEAGFQDAWRVAGLDNRVGGGVSRVVDGELLRKEI